MTNISPTQQEIHALLTECGIKPSVQRIAVTGYILTHHTHPTAEEVYQSLLDEYPTLSRTTVYSTLKRLVESRRIKIIDGDHNNARFDGNTKEHAHFICSRCGNIKDLHHIKMPYAPPQLNVSDTQVIFHGICEKCETN